MKPIVEKLVKVRRLPSFSDLFFMWKLQDQWRNELLGAIFLDTKTLKGSESRKTLNPNKPDSLPFVNYIVKLYTIHQTEKSCSSNLSTGDWFVWAELLTLWTCEPLCQHIRHKCKASPHQEQHQDGLYWAWQAELTHRHTECPVSLFSLFRLLSLISSNKLLL